MVFASFHHLLLLLVFHSFIHFFLPVFFPWGFYFIHLMLTVMSFIIMISVIKFWLNKKWANEQWIYLVKTMTVNKFPAMPIVTTHGTIIRWMIYRVCCNVSMLQSSDVLTPSPPTPAPSKAAKLSVVASLNVLRV